MNHVRFGVIGIGSMGAAHARSLLSGKIPRATLAATCDSGGPPPADLSAIPHFPSATELIRSGLVDAVLIATPHYSHTTIGIEALQAGLHVLVEKPVSVHKADCLRLLAAHKNPSQVFGAMFNQRTDPGCITIRNLIRDGGLGPVRRIQWTITNWFRTQRYYDSGGWRATWAGEGGGVLLNQCPHQLDLWQWMFGMPSKIRAFCAIGRYHDIEVEDDVTAYLEYPDGATGVFITSTGEAPGTNRLEIAGDQGRLVFENGRIEFTRNTVSMTEFCRTDPGRFSTPPVWHVQIPLPAGNGPQHNGIIENFTCAILDGAPLIAPAAEGIHSVELANAMLMSSFEDRSITLPLDAAAYEELLKKKIAASRYVKKTAAPAPDDDFSKSFR